ncbi:unnamed protein product [Urochloa humidicola]
MNPHEDTKSTNNKPILSRLHEVLVATKTMPIEDPSSKRQTIQPDFRAPQEPLPSLLPHTVPTTGTPVSSNPFKFTANSNKQQETFSLEHDFLTTPVSDYLSLSDSKAIMSMDAPPITSLLQGDPAAVLHAHLNIIQGSDLGPIFEDPTQVPVKETTSASDNVLQSMPSSMRKNRRGRDIYYCKICPAKFFSPKAFGGHMSHHSKEKIKEGKSTTSTGTE